MATIVETKSGFWKVVIGRTGWPATSKTFRAKRDAGDSSRRAEDEMVRGGFKATSKLVAIQFTHLFGRKRKH